MKQHRERFRRRMIVMVASMALMIGFMSIAAYASAPSGGASVAGVTAAFLSPVMMLQREVVPEIGAGLTEKELLIVKTIKEQTIAKMTELIAKDPDIVALKQLKDDITAAKGLDELKLLRSQLDELGLKFTALSDEEKTSKGVTLGDAFEKAMNEMFGKGEFEKLRGNKSHSVNMKVEIKAAATMTTANILPSVVNAVPFTLAAYEAGLTRIVRRMPFILQLVNMGTTIKKIVQWAEQVNPDPGTAGMTAEGAAKTKVDFDIQEASAEVKKITAYIKVSREMLDDVDYMTGEINTELLELLRLKLDEQVLSGDNTGSNMKGIMEYAPAFDAGSFANAISGANNADVLRVAINQVESATPNGPFLVNYIVMHPSDVTLMDLTKDAEDRYLIYPFMSRDNTVMKGIPIIQNIGMTEGSFLVGDFTKSRVLMRKDAELMVGYENDDFTKNLVTILGEIRAVHYIKSNYTKAFVTGDFSDAISDLNT